MKIDRVLQNNILMFLLEKYPASPGRDFAQLEKMAGSGEALAAILLYFEDHGIIAPGSVTRSIDGSVMFNTGKLILTAKGIDFLAADGGIGAVLNTVTVKIHDDSLVRIEAFLRQSSLSHQDKNVFLARLKELPSEAIKHVALKLVDLGLENAPAALQLLQKALG